MFKVVLYENESGYSELFQQLCNLEERARTIKDARIKLGQIKLCVDLLKLKETRLPSTILKHLDNDIWELRPGKNRILFFYNKQINEFVLLHMFVKKTQKTPKQEIEKAIREMKDCILRNGGKKDENMGRSNWRT